MANWPKLVHNAHTVLFLIDLGYWIIPARQPVGLQWSQTPKGVQPSFPVSNVFPSPRQGPHRVVDQSSNRFPRGRGWPPMSVSSSPLLDFAAHSLQWCKAQAGSPPPSKGTRSWDLFVAWPGAQCGSSPPHHIPSHLLLRTTSAATGWKYGAHI